jgi:branched-chain amino acid transport system ATP-binding protein
MLRVEGLSKRFGGIVATDHVGLAVEAGRIHALIGPNGAGKSTLVNQLSGEILPDAGSIRFLGEDITRWPIHARVAHGLVRSYQVTSVMRGFTARENVMLAVQARSGHSFHFWRPMREEAALREPALAALARVGLAERGEVRAAHLAHGEQRQLEIAMALATRPRLLLLDEPLAGMGSEEAARMVELLRALRADHAILLIEHDMDAVFSLADDVTVLVHGRAIATGPPAAVRDNAEVQSAYLGEGEHA